MERFAYYHDGLELTGASAEGLLLACRALGVVVHGDLVPLDVVREEIDRECHALSMEAWVRRERARGRLERLRRFVDET